jgi:hypothetical protein
MSGSHVSILLWRAVENIAKHSKNFATHPVAWVKGHRRTFWHSYTEWSKSNESAPFSASDKLLHI